MRTEHAIHSQPGNRASVTGSEVFMQMRRRTPCLFYCPLVSKRHRGETANPMPFMQVVSGTVAHLLWFLTLYNTLVSNTVAANTVYICGF